MHILLYTLKHLQITYKNQCSLNAIYIVATCGKFNFGGPLLFGNFEQNNFFFHLQLVLNVLMQHP